MRNFEIDRLVVLINEIARDLDEDKSYPSKVRELRSIAASLAQFKEYHNNDTQDS